eukprot:6196892-Pleurochrysis_carterae.AAC.1
MLLILCDGERLGHPSACVSVSECVRVGVGMRGCVCACVCACVRACVYVRMRAAPKHPAFEAEREKRAETGGRLGGGAIGGGYE